MYICNHFSLPELVYPEIYHRYKADGKLDTLWLAFDPRVLKIADALRETYGGIYVNTWEWGGQLSFCGLRPTDCKIGADLSQHKFGRALDLHFNDISSVEVRRDIMEGKFKEDCPDISQITCMEFGISWFHFDVRNSTDDEIIKIYL